MTSQQIEQSSSANLAISEYNREFGAKSMADFTDLEMFKEHGLHNEDFNGYRFSSPSSGSWCTCYTWEC